MDKQCPIPQITDQLGRDTATTPSPLHFDWSDENVVGIPRQLIHQIHRYDFSYPTGSYEGKLFFRGQRLVWIDRDGEGLCYKSRPYKEIGEYDPNPHLEPCPLCKGEAYSGFEARSVGDTVKFHITCMDCQLTFGNEYKFPLKRAIDYSYDVIERWNTRADDQRTVKLLETLEGLASGKMDQWNTSIEVFRGYVQNLAQIAIEKFKEGESND